MKTWLGIWFVALAGFPWGGFPWVGATSTHADTLTRVDGQHIRLITDVAPDEAAVLVDSFDAAVPQWAAAWDVPADRLDAWTVDAWVMRDEQTFFDAGQIKADVPDFPYGYAIDQRVYVKAQPSAYYTRHLLLHEGTHALAFHLFPGAGPTWFMEGTAEWLATHRDSGAQIQVGTIPGTAEEVPYWGRFTALKQLRQADQLPSIETVMRYRPNLLGEVPTYGCAWAAIRMMHAYPEYRPLIRQAADRGQKTTMVFNRLLMKQIAPSWPIFAARWRLWTESLDYGFDPSRNTTDLSIDDPLWKGQPIRRKVTADRGWQSIGVRIPAGVSVKIQARGQVTLAEKPKPWICHPPGVTIRYHRGMPLGQLVAIVLPNVIPDVMPDDQTLGSRPLGSRPLGSKSLSSKSLSSKSLGSKSLPPLARISIGESATVRVAQASWLLLRVNDATGELDDNQGSYDVSIRPSGK